MPSIELDRYLPRFAKLPAMNAPELPAQPHPEHNPPPDPEELRLIRSEELLGGAQEILIEHDGQTYRLRLTRSGKLILHK